MSNQQDNLDSKLSEAKKNAHKLLKGKKSKKKDSEIEVAEKRSVKSIVLWLLAIVALISATLVNLKLPAIWQPANDIWVRVGLIATLIIFSIICLALTNQGKSFKVLLRDAGVELRRVTWPLKSETIQYTWQTLLVIGIVALIVWLLDSFFNWFVRIFIG